MGKGSVKGSVQGAQDGLLSGMVMGGLGGAAQALSGHSTLCFVAGTTILTMAGKKAIETVEIGDVIPCADHITGESAEKKVISTSVNKVNKLFEIEVEKETLQCTANHPFQVKGKGWSDACNLQPEDVVYTKNWNTTVVKSVNLLEFDEPVEVFNFEVEDCHTYFVGDSLLLVHNSCNHGKEWRAERRRHWKSEADAYKGNVHKQWSDSGTYKVTRNNMKRMSQGKAPIERDGFSVQLHHYHDGGIAADMYAYAEITRFEHFANFKNLHPWLFG